MVPRTPTRIQERRHRTARGCRGSKPKNRNGTLHDGTKEFSVIKPEVYWVQDPPRLLAFGARPRSGEWLVDQIRGYRDLGFRHVVSLLEPSEIRELDLGKESQLCVAHDMVFHSLPIPDRGTPPRNEETIRLIQQLAKAIADNQSVFIHCRAGIGRSGCVAALVLLRLGLPVDAVFPLLSKTRGVRVPDTEQQEHWIRTLATSVISDQPPAAAFSPWP